MTTSPATAYRMSWLRFSVLWSCWACCSALFANVTAEPNSSLLYASMAFSRVPCASLPALVSSTVCCAASIASRASCESVVKWWTELLERAWLAPPERTSRNCASVYVSAGSN
jgi:hypothetical protein